MCLTIIKFNIYLTNHITFYSNYFNYSINPSFGQTITLLIFTNSNACLNDKCFFFIKYAITIVADLETPAIQ